MRHAFDILVPANTSEFDPVTLTAKLNAGTLTAALIRFKSGCHNRVKIKVSDNLYQLIPATGSDALDGDKIIYDIPMDYPLDTEPYILTITGSSPGTIYDHLITVWFDVIPPRLSSAPPPAENLLLISE